MMFRLLLAGTSALLPDIAFAEDAIPPRPLNRATWVTRSDYPIDQFLKGVQGTTAFAVTVGPDGKPRDCRIIESSGSPELDAIVCDRVSIRAKFAAARGSDGRKIQGQYRNRVTWYIPPEQAAEEAEIRALAARDQAARQRK